MRWDAILFVDKDRTCRFLAIKVQMLQPTTLSPGMKVRVRCQLKTEPNRPIGLVGNCVQGNNGVAVAATVYQHGRKGRTLARHINVTVLAPGVAGRQPPKNFCTAHQIPNLPEQYWQLLCESLELDRTCTCTHSWHNMQGLRDTRTRMVSPASVKTLRTNGTTYLG